MKKSDHKYLIKLDRNNTNFTVQLFEYLKGATWGHEYDFLKYYQNLVRIYINDVDLDARGCLIYHTMGIGKSMLAIAIAMDLIKERQPIILLTKSLQENMRNTIYKYVNLRRSAEPDYALGRMSDADLDAWINKNYSFVSMNASNMLKQMGRAAEGHSVEEFDIALEKKLGEVLKIVSLDGKLLIVDEAHNFFRAITNGSKNAQGLYDMVMKAENLKIVFLSGTPIANDPFELVPCFNMIGSKRGEIILPEIYNDFYKLFVDMRMKGAGVGNKIKNKEKFQNRILGLTSYISNLTEPGRALGLTDAATRAEFPEELPIIVERVHMDPEQYVMYQLARDREKDEGSGKFGPSREPPALTKPKSRAASTYRVMSRQLCNFNPPAQMRNEKDPNKIPVSDLGSAKYKKMLSNINKHPNQLGIVYSQFVGVGGLGTFSRYLESQNWERVHIGSTNAVNSNDVSNDDIIGGDETITNMSVTRLGGRHKPKKNRSALPSVTSYLTKIENEIKKYSGSSMPIHRLNIRSPFKYGASDDITDVDDSSDDITDITDITDDHNDDITDINDEYDINNAIVLNNTQITFKYACVDDIDIIKSINPAYDPKAVNDHLLIVFENEIPSGYVTITQNTPANAPSGQGDNYIVGEYLQNVSDVFDRDKLKKIITDAINCRGDGYHIKKHICGGSVDPARATPINIPNRRRRFAIISGEIATPLRTQIQDIFNSNDNKYGGEIDLILLSSTGAEGLDLKNVRHIHIMEPYWNLGRIRQIIARGVRNDSHKNLSAGEKNVAPYIYLAVPPETETLASGLMPPTTDTELYEESIILQILIDSFTEALREVSIECMINDEKYCRTCNPTNTKLYSDNIFKDISSPDPCTALHEEQIRATEIIIDDVKYYYTASNTSIYDYNIFMFDERVNGYRPMKETDPLFTRIIDAINAHTPKDSVVNTDVVNTDVVNTTIAE